MMESDVVPASRGGRRKAVWSGLAALVILVAAGTFPVQRALGTCEFLDRWFGRSGCTTKLFVAGYRPLGFATAVPGGTTTMRLFGFGGTGSDVPSQQVEVDWISGVETARSNLPLGTLNFLIRPSRDGTRVAVICTASDTCFERRPQGYVFDTRSGTVVEELTRANYIDWSFPRERPSGPISFDAAIPNGRDLLIEPDPNTGGIVLLKLADRSEVARLAPPDSYRTATQSPSAIAVRASPSGRFVALIDNIRLYPAGGGSRIDVWDIDERRLVRTLTTDARHTIDTNAAWTGDEQHLFGFRNWTDMTTSERQHGSEAYVFDLR